MKTARELLFEEVINLLSKTPAEAAVDMKKIMARYRVQTKPGVEIAGAATARDALGDRLLGLLKAGGNDEPTKQKIGTTIDEFRMQLKQAGNDKPPPPPRAVGALPLGAKPMRPTPPPLSTPKPASPPPLSAKKPPSPSPLRDSPPPPPATSKVRPSVTLGVGEAPARLPRSAEPVAGGPRARKKARAECPKCHSMGVVLARSYSGDEYYSCIYCGWQAYKPADEDDPNASLALRLLGQTAGTE